MVTAQFDVIVSSKGAVMESGDGDIHNINFFRGISA